MRKSNTKLEDLAARAGVSISTVSRALNDSPAVNARTKQAIWKLARELDYPFRRYMPAGPIGAEGTIAVVVPDPQGRDASLTDSFFLKLFAGVAEAARERGCDVIFSHVAPTTHEELAAAMETTRADGVIFLGQSSLHEAFNRLAEEDQRFVVWGAQLPNQRYCSVGSDNLAGSHRATRHLLRIGRKRLVFMGDAEAPEAMQRLRGYLQALDEADLPQDDDLIAPAHFEIEGAEAATDALLSRGVSFDGIVAASDLIALGAIRALQRAGLTVPGDVSVVGYDNVPLAQFNRPALSTIDQDTAKAGRLLVSKLLGAKGGKPPRSERLPTELIVRQSCGG
jgi:DNA-binding LacI/PurR family transcriptional regulator